MKKLLRNQNKIIIDISKDKLDTINEANNNSKKKENNQSLFINIFKKQSLKRINILFEQKIKKNNYKTKGKSISNIISPHNNKCLNSRIEKKSLNISSLLSPVKSDRIILRNRENVLSSIIYKKSIY